MLSYPRLCFECNLAFRLIKKMPLPCLFSNKHHYNLYNKYMWKNVHPWFEPTTFGTWASSHNHSTRAPSLLPLDLFHRDSPFNGDWRRRRELNLKRSKVIEINPWKAISISVMESTEYYFKWAIPGLFVSLSVFSIQLRVNCQYNWIRTADLWNWKRPLYQLSHNHCTSLENT